MAITISPNYVRGMTTSIQYEAADQVRAPVNETARRVAADWISPVYRPVTFVTNNNYSSNYSSTGGLFGGGNTTVNHIVNNPASAPRNTPTSAPRSREEREEDSARTCALIGSILSVIAAVGVGYGYSLLTAQRESLHKIQDVKHALYYGTVEDVSPEVLGYFTRLVNVQLEIDELNTQKITNYFLSAVGVFAGGIALASGGFMMVPALMTAGKIILLLSAIGGALNFGLHFNDGSKIAKNYKMILGDPSQGTQGLADRILSALHTEQANRGIRTQVAGEGRGMSHTYVPLVPSTYVPNGPISPDCPSMDIPSDTSNKDLYRAAQA